MKKITLSLLVILASLSVSFAQQDAMFTKYMFNTLAFNPAYAGSNDHLSVGLLHRTQWWGIDGAPSTQSFSIHTPLKYDKIGLGLNVVNDKIGPTGSTSANISYAYHIPLTSQGMQGLRLSVGLQGGITNWRANWSELNIDESGDDAFSEENPSYWLPNFGLGFYLYNPNKFFVGIASPHLIEHDLRQENMNTDIYARSYRHYYFSAGGAIPLDGLPHNDSYLLLRPYMLVKTAGLFSSFKPQDSAFNNVGTPTEFDIDLSLVIYRTFWIGTSYRSSIEAFMKDENNQQLSSFDSVDIWAAYFFKNGLRLGAAYDYTLTKLQQPAQGSFEVFVGYEFDFETPRIVTPRYF